MLCSHVFQPSFSPLMDFHWPVRSLWPETRPLFYRQQILLRNMQDMKNNLAKLETIHQKIFEEIDQVSATVPIQPVSYKMEKEGESFSLTLDTKDFSPEELSVKQVGRKLRVSGKTEKKQEDGNGSYSYKCQEFRQEFDLPEGVNPEAVTCSLSDGRLQIRAPRQALPESTERAVPINSSPDVNIVQCQSSQDEGSTTETQIHLQRTESAKA